MAAEMADRYVENSTFTIPHLQNGVHDLGDLWDCRKSLSVQHNLFSKSMLSKEHLQATSLKNSDYTFTHVKNELDKTRNLKVDGHVSIDLFLKVISLDGSIEYNATETENCENFIVNYTYEDHKIYLMSPLEEMVVNSHLIEKLNSREIEATHVVGGIIVGGEVHGVVEVKSKNDSSKLHLAGGGKKKQSTVDDMETGNKKLDQTARKLVLGKQLMEKLSGCVTGELKATWLSADVNNTSDMRVSFKAKPTSFDALPTATGENNSGNGPSDSVKSMFECVENMPKTIQSEKSFQKYGEDIFGVPIRFILYPLSHYIEFRLQPLYKQLDDSVMRRFQETVSQIIDIQQSAYVRKLILEEDEDMRFFLDSKSPLLDDVSQFQKQLQDTGAKFEVRCRKVMSDYKFGKQCQDDIESIVKEFNQSEAGSVCKKVQEFVATGRLELLNGQVFQAKSKMMIFTDRGNLDKWYGKNTGPMILMETNSSIPPGAIKGLLQLSEFLHDLGIEAGMATPSVSKAATLTFKFCERKTVFVADEMTHALDALKVMAGIGEPTTATFYRILASLKGIRLYVNKENSCELDRLVSELVAVRSSCSNLYCAESTTDLRKQISATDDNSFVFCLPINAPDTDLEFLTKWEDLGKHLPNARWVAYNFDFPDLNEAPLLMIFEDGRLQAICLDNLDVLFLKHQLLKTNSKDLTMLSPENLQNCLFPERAKYALAILNRLEPLRHVQAGENQELLKTRTNNVVQTFLMLLRSFLSGDPSHIALVMKAHSSLKKQILDCTEILQEMESGSRNRDEFDHFKLALNAVIDNPLCADSFKEQMKEALQSGETVDEILSRAKTILEEITRTLKSNKFSKAFKKVWKIVSRSLKAKESVEETLKDLVKEYCTFHEIFEEPLITRIRNYAKDFQPYLVLHSVSPYKHGKGLRLLYEDLRQLTSLNDCEALQKIIQSVSSTLDETQIEALWKNFQWQFLVQKCFESERNAVVFRALWQWLQSTKNKDAFPEHIKAKLDERFKISSKKLKTVKDVAEFFQDTIDLFEEIPCDFKKTLADSLRESEQLERELSDTLTRTEWNSEQKLIEMEWDMEKVKSALRCLTESIESKEALALATDFNLVFLKMPITQHNVSLNNDADKEVAPRFRLTFGNRLRFLTDEEYMTVKRIIPQPVMNAERNLPVLLSLAPYIMQQIKMWNGNILKPYILSSISKPDENSTEESTFSDDPFNTDANSTPSSAQDQVTVHVHSVTRLDVFAYLINAVDCFVAREILRVMSKFPMPLPLIVPDILQENKYIITVPLLENLVIRWQTENAIENQAYVNGSSCKEKEYLKKASHIVENHLFSSPFRLLVAIRLGTHKPGKSHLLNHLMVGENFFSAYDEPGGKHGPPCTLDGTVEFAWLMEETCAGALWKSVLEAHYASHKNEIVLLANMHGEATKHLDILNYLKKFAFGFLVFLMPELDDITRGKWNILKSQIGNKPITFVKVDPKEYVEKNAQMISTSGLTIEATKDKLRGLLKETLTKRGPTTEDTRFSTEHVLTADLGESLRFANGVATEKAQQLAKEINKITCVETKKCMKTFLFKGYDGWKDNNNLKKIIGLAVQLLNSSVGNELKKAFSYLETELSRISALESLNARSRIAETQTDLSDYEIYIKVNDDTQAGDRGEHNENIRKITYKLLLHTTQAEDANLGLEHFFRVFSHIHHIALGHYSTDRLANSGVLDLPKYYATLLLEGNALEILNGDTGTISLNWLRAIFRHVDVLRPNLRVYVISIIGLQSTGKSTLLNALFSCRFAVSVGRCSRGLYMRMIFLEEDLRKEHGYDAIILVDTEGLASPEKMNDPDAIRKDRLLATFAMGLSNFTIVNVLGEELTQITDILQIVIVTMARLREADVKPDMLVVQHVQERNAFKFDEANNQFIAAINRAFDLVSKSDVELGATQNARLKELIDGIQRQDVFLQFNSFKDGSSVHSPPSESYHDDVSNLYQILLRKARDSTRKHSIQRWFQLIENYWNSITQEKFALDFKSAQHITEYLNYNQSVTKIKEALGQAFTLHVDIMSKEIEDEVDRHIGNKEKKQPEDLRTEIIRKMNDQLKKIPYSCEQKCCQSFKSEENKLYVEIKDTEWEYDLKDTIQKCITKKRERESIILKQLFDASVIRRGCFSQFSYLITNELKKELYQRPTAKFTEEEKIKISERIWDCARDVVSKRETDSTLMKEIENAIKENYGSLYSDIWQRIKEGVSELENKNAKKFGKYFSLALNETQHRRLVKEVHSFIAIVLESFNSQCFDVGMKFETAIIAYIKSKFPKLLEAYETETNVELIDDYKYTVLVYALCQFIEKMEKIQEIWNRKHKPSIILLEKESFYKEQIRTRLEHGFSSAADGYVQAGYIIDAAKDKAREAGYRGKIQSVLNHVWTTNSEKVRLQYFEELALEVKDGKKDRAMAHFAKPNASIEKWFKTKCESMYSTEEIQGIYDQTLNTEIDNILQAIRNVTKFEELQIFLQKYYISEEDESCGITKLQENDCVSLRDSIIDKIQEFSQAGRTGYVLQAPASKDKEVMKRLGCTESCPWCGALCWGSRGHDEDKGETRKHHTCHQPNGLIGTQIEKNGIRFLDPRSCYDIPDSENIIHGVEKTTTKWGEAKTKYYSTWKFDKHVTLKFDEMMHWFFQELHKDISARPNKSPVPPEWLGERKQLNLEDILAAVRSVKD